MVPGCQGAGRHLTVDLPRDVLMTNRITRPPHMDPLDDDVPPSGGEVISGDRQYVAYARSKSTGNKTVSAVSSLV